MIDKNLFLYDLAVTAIFKNEARYLKEWIDYHLLAGVDHFYLYNNDSSDDYKEVLAPYIEKNLVTLTDFPGKMMQYPAYNDAIDKYRFECRYMAFIDCDEFIYPKSNRPIVEVVDEILSCDPNAAGLSIHWQCFGSNGQEKADYSRGVLERFTRRAEKDFIGGTKTQNPNAFIGICNIYLKSIVKPLFVENINIHYADFFPNYYSIKENGRKPVSKQHCQFVCADKIAINHYFIKSREEYYSKRERGSNDINEKYPEEKFKQYDRNEVFDDGILKYRAARAKNFSFEREDERITRVINTVIKILTQSEDSLVGELETFLICRVIAEKFQMKLGDSFAEEIALAWIYRILKSTKLTRAETQMFLKALPEILSRPFQICKDIKNLTQKNIIPRFCKVLKNNDDDVLNKENAWKIRSDTIYIQKLLSLIK